MKKLAAIMCVFAFAMISYAQAAEENLPAVPRTTQEITNPEMQAAIKAHSPNYDDLGRGSQVFTYVHMYRSMNDGLTPAIAKEDMEFIYPTQNHEAISSDVVRHYDSTPSIVRETSATVDTANPSDNFERYVHERELPNFNSR